MNNSEDLAERYTEDELAAIEDELRSAISDLENNSGEIDSAKYVDKLTKIDELKANIKVKELKLQEICDRYDDEIKILKQSLGMNETNCPSCNKAYNPNINKFCMNCGQKLG